MTARSGRATRPPAPRLRALSCQHGDASTPPWWSAAAAGRSSRGVQELAQNRPDEGETCSHSGEVLSGDRGPGPRMRGLHAERSCGLQWPQGASLDETALHARSKLVVVLTFGRASCGVEHGADEDVRSRANAEGPVATKPAARVLVGGRCPHQPGQQRSV